ncbi:MAG: VOC family protein [Spirochaetaceae bacterium]|nr:VOC family protein [Spirochaetaceae bacterium]
MKITGVHHINVETKDMDKAIKFYTEILGLKLKFRKDLESKEIAFIDAGNTIIELFKEDDKLNKKHIDGVVNHFAFKVVDINAVVANCREKGVKVTSEVSEIVLDGDIRYAFIEGPENERIELFEYI